MYSNVFGVGVKNEANKKLIFGNDINFFHGNSFLSLYETIKKSLED